MLQIKWNASCADFSDLTFLCRETCLRSTDTGDSTCVGSPHLALEHTAQRYHSLIHQKSRVFFSPPNKNWRVNQHLESGSRAPSPAPHISNLSFWYFPLERSSTFFVLSLSVWNKIQQWLNNLSTKSISSIINYIYLGCQKKWHF